MFCRIGDLSIHSTQADETMLSCQYAVKNIFVHSISHHTMCISISLLSPSYVYFPLQWIRTNYSREVREISYHSLTLSEHTESLLHCLVYSYKQQIANISLMYHCLFIILPFIFFQLIHDMLLELSQKYLALSLYVDHTYSRTTNHKDNKLEF